MATQTLAVAAQYIQNNLVKGVAQDIIDVNPMYASLPFTGYTGQAIITNREPANIDLIASTAIVGENLGVGVYKTQTSSPTATTFRATKFIGDVELDGLVAAESGSAGVDQAAFEISSKAKSISRQFQRGMVQGTGTAPAMNSLHSMCDPTKYTTASVGQALSFALMDELIDLVLAKDGEVDYIMMPQRTLRSYKALLRAQGGTTADWIVNLPDGRTTIGYEGIPVFKNTFINTTETANGAALAGGALTSVYAGVFDDGSNKIGLAAIHPEGTPAGIAVTPIGAQINADAELWRVKQYANLALFNRQGLARLTSINN